MVVLTEPSLQKSLQDDLIVALQNLSDTTDLIIVEAKPDKRTAYYKDLKKQTDFRSFDPLDQGALAGWLVQEAKRQQGSIGTSHARYLIERVGANQMRLANELAKLIDFQPQITRETIDAMTSPTAQSSTFDLLDAALSGNSKAMVRLYQDQRQQKVEPLAILGLIAWQLHILALIKVAGDRNPGQIAKEAGLNPYVVSKSVGITNKVPLQTIKSWVHQASQLDTRLKSQQIDADEALLHYLLSLN